MLYINLKLVKCGVSLWALQMQVDGVASEFVNENDHSKITPGSTRVVGMGFLELGNNSLAENGSLKNWSTNVAVDVKERENSHEVSKPLVGIGFIELGNAKIVPTNTNKITPAQQSSTNTSPVVNIAVDKQDATITSNDLPKNTEEDDKDDEASLALSKDLHRQLEAAASAAHQLRLRITLCTTGVGALLLFGFITAAILADNRYTQYSWGMTLPCAAIMAMGIMPDDIKLIRGVSLVGVFAGLAIGYMWISLSYKLWFVDQDVVREYQDEEVLDDCGANLPQAGCVARSIVILITGMNSIIILGFGLMPNLMWVKGAIIYDRTKRNGFRWQDSAFKVSSRMALERFWFRGRLFCAAASLHWFWFAVVSYFLDDRYPRFTDERFKGHIFQICVTMPIAVVFTPHRRGRIIAYLTTIVTKGETKSAASIAALLGGVNPTEGLKIAKEKFRSIPFISLTKEDFDDNKEKAGDKNRLHGMTKSTKLGHCDAFMSHSWSDDGEGKFNALQTYAEEFYQKHNRYPSIWLDKACINQNDIDSDLMCLPVFLAGCAELLIIPGSTYKERLWCIIEVFVFIKMGGNIQRVTILPIDMENEQEAQLMFAKVDVEACKCYLDKDRQRLLAIIEHGFGSFDDFNEIVRELFKERLSVVKTFKSSFKTQRSESYKVEETKEDSPPPSSCDVEQIE